MANLELEPVRRLSTFRRLALGTWRTAYDPSVYGSLTLRRGMTTSGEWYQWWDMARASAAGARKTVMVILMDGQGADVNRWTFSQAQPTGYFVSQLDALNGGVLVESLELSIAGFTMAFGDRRAAR